MSLPPSFFVKALYSYAGQNPGSLTFTEGDIIEVLSTLPSGWWDGLLMRKPPADPIRGWFPSNYVEPHAGPSTWQSREAEFNTTLQNVPQLETLSPRGEDLTSNGDLPANDLKNDKRVSGDFARVTETGFSDVDIVRNGSSHSKKETNPLFSKTSFSSFYAALESERQSNVVSSKNAIIAESRHTVQNCTRQLEMKGIESAQYAPLLDAIGSLSRLTLASHLYQDVREAKNVSDAIKSHTKDELIACAHEHEASLANLCTSCEYTAPVSMHVPETPKDSVNSLRWSYASESGSTPDTERSSMPQTPLSAGTLKGDINAQLLRHRDRIFRITERISMVGAKGNEGKARRLASLIDRLSKFLFLVENLELPDATLAIMEPAKKRLFDSFSTILLVTQASEPLSSNYFQGIREDVNSLVRAATTPSVKSSAESLYHGRVDSSQIQKLSRNLQEVNLDDSSKDSSVPTEVPKLGMRNVSHDSNDNGASFVTGLGPSFTTGANATIALSANDVRGFSQADGSQYNSLETKSALPADQEASIQEVSFDPRLKHSGSKKSLRSLLSVTTPPPAPHESTKPVLLRGFSSFFDKKSQQSTPQQLNGVNREISSLLGPDYAPGDVIYSKNGQILGAHLDTLIILATTHEGRVDSDYLAAFLMTFPTFCSYDQLLQKLAGRMAIDAPPGLEESDLSAWRVRKQLPIKARVTNLVKTWVRDYFDPSENHNLDLQILDAISLFAERYVAEGGQQRQILKLVQDRRLNLRALKPPQVAAVPPALQIVPPVFVPNTPIRKVTDIPPMEMARQLSIQHARLFAAISGRECLHKAWPKLYPTGSPNVQAVIEASNALSQFIIEDILSAMQVADRAALLGFWLDVADICDKINNFSVLMHILAAFNSSAVYRLSQTWNAVDPLKRQCFERLGERMSPLRNYRVYRDIVRSAAPPCVPFLGVYLSDWTFVGDGSSDVLKDHPSYINFGKRLRASELILLIKLHQATTYAFEVSESVMSFLNSVLKPVPQNLEERDQLLFERSLQLEPRLENA